MSWWKETKSDGSIEFHNDMGGAALHMIPEGCVPCSDAEADAALNPPKAALLVKQEVWGKIKAKRDQLRFDGGVKVGMHWFLSSEIATSEYNTLLLLSAGIPDTTVLRANWRTIDGAVVDMTPALVKQILTAGFAQVAAIDDAAQTHRAAMEAAADPAAYNYSAGWPATFPG